MLVIALMFAASVNAQKNTVFNIFIDLTEEGLIESYKKQVIEAVPEILNEAGIWIQDGVYTGEAGVELRFHPITNIAGLASTKVVIPFKEEFWYDNVYVRNDEIRKAIKKIPSALKRFSYGEGYDYTRIYDNIKSVPGVENSVVIVFSDLFENSDDVSVYDAYPNVLTHDALEKLKLKDVYFVRGINEPSNQSYIRLSEYAMDFWKSTIPGVIISSKLEL